MRSKFAALGAAALVAASTLALSTTAGADKSAKILEWDTMVGVPNGYLGAAGAFRAGVPGGGLPWVVGRADGELRANGKLEIEVEGVVFDPNDPVTIQRGLAGRNTVPTFKAIVSCQTLVNGVATVVNVATDPVPADEAGNAEFDTKVMLPSPCIAPIVYVSTGSAIANNWFATTGM